MENQKLENLITENDCKKILSKHPNQKTIIIDYEITKLSDKIIGYLGDHFRLKIIYENPNLCKSSFFMKTLPQFNRNQNSYVQEMGIFVKEALVYKNLIPELLKLSKVQFAPKCYYVTNQCIILEDMGEKGFKMVEEPFFSVKQTESVMKTLANFHASCLVFEEKRGVSLGEKYTKEISESTFSFTKGHVRQKWCVSLTKCLQDCIRLAIDEKSEEICEKLHKIISCDFPKLIQASKQFRNVLNHDDLHRNNLMFNGEQCVIVDFQLVRYVPPAFDVLLVLFMNLETSVLDKKMDYLLNIYYSSLSEALKLHNLNVENFISREEFTESLIYYRIPALIEATMYGTNVFLTEELSNYIISNIDVFSEFTFTNRSKYITKEYKENTVFRNRFNCVLLPLIEALHDF